jgi:hypothetical protein
LLFIFVKKACKKVITIVDQNRKTHSVKKFHGEYFIQDIRRSEHSEIIVFGKLNARGEIIERKFVLQRLCPLKNILMFTEIGVHENIKDICVTLDSIFFITGKLFLTQRKKKKNKLLFV